MLQQWPEKGLWQQNAPPVGKWGKFRISNALRIIMIHNVSYGYGSKKFKKQIWMIWIATRWSGRVERRSYANDLKWILSLQTGMDRGKDGGSGPYTSYILSCHLKCLTCWSHAYGCRNAAALRGTSLCMNKECPCSDQKLPCTETGWNMSIYKYN